jgi:hypothetical protein
MREKDPRLAALTKARPAALDPDRLAGSRRQHDDLVAILATEPGSARTRRPARTYRWIAIPVAGLAVAVAGVVVVATTLSSPPSRSTPTVAAATNNHQPSATPDGQVVLLDVAKAIEHETGSGAYWEQDTRSGTVGIVHGAQPYSIASTDQQRWSIGVRPGEQSLWQSGINATTQPRTAQDRARWQAAGSPTHVQLDTGLVKPGAPSGVLLDTTIGAHHQFEAPTNDGSDILSIGADNVTYADLQRLPSDVAGLTNYLAQQYTQDKEGFTDSRTEWMFRQASDLIEMPVSSQVRASAYRILAALPGITSLGTVTDALGRTGVGVAVAPWQQGDLGTAQEELIVDTTTNTLLADQIVLVRPSSVATAAGLAAGTPLYYTATTQIGWTNQPLHG